MFKEKLHNDIDRITPSEELLDRVSLMMKEEASRKKPKIYMTAVKYGSLAAAVCLITALFIALGSGDKSPEPLTSELSVKLADTGSGNDTAVYLVAAAETGAAGMSDEGAATEAAAEMPTEAAITTTAAGMSTEAAITDMADEPRVAGLAADGADAGGYALCETETVSEGCFLPCENDGYLLINDTMGPVVLSPENNDNSIFDELTAGDVVRVTHGLVLTTYPGKTTVFAIEKIADGDLADISADTLEQLRELGWIPLTDSQGIE